MFFAGHLRLAMETRLKTKNHTQLGDEKQFDEQTPNKVMKTNFDEQETNVVWSFCWRDFPDVQKKT